MNDYAEKLYFGQSRRPHCKTCVCDEEVEIKSKITVSKTQLQCRPMMSPSKKKNFTCDCGYPRRQAMELDWDTIRPPILSPRRIDRKCQCDNNKYGTLEKWFRRFDFDCNGLLDLFELRTMLNFLGVQAKDDYCKRLLDRADRDGDGRLTFTEFLLMWRLAQDEEDLVHIIRDHDLFPDVVQMDYVSKIRPKPQLGRVHKCSCESTTTKAFRIRPKEESVIYESRISHAAPIYDEKLPIFSCYR